VIRNRGRAQSGDSASDAQPPGNEVANRPKLLRCMSPELIQRRSRLVARQCLLSAVNRTQDVDSNADPRSANQQLCAEDEAA
jgi:hypothetical protein